MTSLEVVSWERIEPERYDGFVREQQGSTVFHERRFHEAVAASLGAELTTLVARRGGAIAAALPLAVISSPLRGRRLVSFPFCRYLPPLGDTEALAALLEHVAPLARARGCRFAELRAGPDLPLATAPFVRRHHFDTFSIDVRAGLERIWSGLHPRGARRSVRRSLSSRLEIRRVAPATGDPATGKDDPGKGDRGKHEPDQDDLVRLGAIIERLDRLARRRQGALHHPPGLLTALLDRFAASGDLRLLLAELDGEVVAVELALRHGDTVHGILAADLAATARPLRANHRLIFELLRWAAEEGASTVDLGPAHRENVGLTAFKREVGAVSRPADTWYLAITAQPPEDGGLDRAWVRGARGALARAPLGAHHVLSRWLVGDLA